MNRRGFLSALAGVAGALVLPHEPRRVYSFARELRVPGDDFSPADIERFDRILRETYGRTDDLVFRADDYLFRALDYAPSAVEQFSTNYMYRLMEVQDRAQARVLQGRIERIFDVVARRL